MNNANNIINGIYKYESENKIINFFDASDDKSNLLSNNQLNSIFKKISLNDNIAIKESNTIVYKLNDKFHTTILYTGGKEEPKSLEFEPLVGTDINLLIKSFGISDNFIVCGIEIIDKSIPYYGNHIQHITIGLKKMDSPKFKLFPKDSPTAFDKGVKIELNKPCKITGKICREIKKIL